VSYAVISCDLHTVDRLRVILAEIGRARRVVTYETALAEGLAA
jgi:hypothetical protein